MTLPDSVQDRLDQIRAATEEAFGGMVINTVNVAHVQHWAAQWWGCEPSQIEVEVGDCELRLRLPPEPDQIEVHFTVTVPEDEK